MHYFHYKKGEHLELLVLLAMSLHNAPPIGKIASQIQRRSASLVNVLLTVFYLRLYADYQLGVFVSIALKLRD